MPPMGKKRGTNSRARRILGLHRILLEGESFSVADLVDRVDLDVASRRTWERDVILLREVLADQLECDEEPGGRKYYRLVLPGRRSQQVRARQLFALEVGALFAGSYLGPSHHSETGQLVEALKSELKTPARTELEELLSRTRVLGAWRRRSDEDGERGQYFRALFEGLQTDMAVEVRLQNTGQALRELPATVETVKPLTLVLYRRDAHFVVQFCDGPRGGDFGIISLADVSFANLTEDPFEPPSDADRFGLLRRAWRIRPEGDVKQVTVRVDAELAPWIKSRQWHHSEDVEDLPDGGLLFRVEVAGDEVLEWILAMGEHAEVLGPPELRDVAREKLAAALARYND